jgi:hypothetical protein
VVEGLREKAKGSLFSRVDIKAAKQHYSDKLDAAKAEEAARPYRDHKLFAQCKLDATLPNQLTHSSKVRMVATRQSVSLACRVFTWGGRLCRPAHCDILTLPEENLLTSGGGA